MDAIWKLLLQIIIDTCSPGAAPLLPNRSFVMCKLTVRALEVMWRPSEILRTIKCQASVSYYCSVTFRTSKPEHFRTIIHCNKILMAFLLFYWLQKHKKLRSLGDTHRSLSSKPQCSISYTKLIKVVFFSVSRQSLFNIGK